MVSPVESRSQSSDTPTPSRVTAADPAARAQKMNHRTAALLLAERDPVVARLVAEVGNPHFPKPTESNYATIVRAVTHQQLAGPAARAIHGRLVALLEGEVTPERLLASTTEALRSVGLSASKVLSLQDLSAKALDGTVRLDGRHLARESDEEVVRRLTLVRGIGKWSAEMFLMFQLRRLDIWPTGDLGVRKGFGLAWGIDMPTPNELERLGETFRPYRSVVAWYCWRAIPLYRAVPMVE
jgi:DNA-3-methyladenine glycosylase II